MKPLEIKGTSPDLCIREDGVVALSFVDPSKRFSIRCSVFRRSDFLSHQRRNIIV